MADFTTNYGWAIEIEYNENYYAQAVALREAIDTTVKSVEDKADANTAALATHKANGDTDILHVTADEKASITHAEYIWQTAIQELTATESDVPGANLITNGCFESGLTGWSSASGSSLSLDTAVKVCGTQACKIDVPSGDGRGDIVYSTTIFDADETYRLSFFIYGDGVTEAIQVIGGSYASGLISIVEGWQSVSVDMSRDADGSFQVAGYYTAADAAFYFLIDGITARPLEEVANTDKKLDVIVWENGFLQSEDLSTSWANSEITPLATSVQSPISGVRYYGQVGASGTAFKYSAQSYTLPSAGRITVGAFMKEGDLDWSKIRNSSNSQETYFNVATGDKGSSASTNRYRHIDHGDYGRLVMVELDGVAGANDLRYYPCNADNNGQSTGDGSTVNMHITGMRVRAGTIEEFISYIKTTTAAYPRTQLVEIQTDPALKHAAGFVLTADGAWVPTSTVNGLLMDESPANVAAMRQAGLYNAVESGAWGPLVAGITFWANDDSGDYLNLFEGAAIAGCPAIFDPTLTRPAPSASGRIYQMSCRHSDGDIWQSEYDGTATAGAIPVPTFFYPGLPERDNGATDGEGAFAGFYTTYAGMELCYSFGAHNNGANGDLSYSIKAKWRWRDMEITP